MEDITPLALAAAGGDQVALERMIAASYSDVRRLCAVLVDDPSADDLAQETFSQALRALRRFRGEASARTWLLSIARNVCADELRTRVRRRRRDHQLIQEAAVAPQTADQSERHEIIDLISRLEPARREAFVLTQLLQLSYDEAASICGCPRGTIHSRVARARDDLISLYDATHTGRASRADVPPGSQAQDVSD